MEFLQKKQGFVIIENPEADCKGLIYRAERRLYETDRGFNETVRMRLVKKLSCPGCKDCIPILDEMREMIPEGDFIEGMENVKDGGLYELHLNCWPSGNWEWPESEYDCELSLVKVKE